MVKVGLSICWCWATLFCFAQPARQESFVNPTGTYILKGQRQGGEIVGNFAEIRIKLVSDSSVAVAMYCNKGYPEYTSATLTDTITYIGNMAVYTRSNEFCRIQFDFDPHRLHIKRIYTDPSSTCGFGKGVLPLGFIKKHSSSIPLMQPISRPD